MPIPTLFGLYDTSAVAVVRSFTISPSVGGHSTWNLDVLGPLVLSSGGAWTIVPTSTFQTSVKAWGGGGASGGIASIGAGSGFAGGTVTLSSGTTYTLTVGEGGTYPSPGTPTTHGGGGPSTAEGQGGGYVGITQSSTDILIAPGGGGGGFGGDGGPGGGATGSDGTAFSADNTEGRGGTPSAGGAAGVGAVSAGSARLGGTGGGGGTPGGGGGGGHFGGGGGGYAGGGGAGGGGGGSGFANPGSVSSATLTSGSGVNPGNNSDPDRATAGVGGAVSGNSGTAGLLRLS